MNATSVSARLSDPVTRWPGFDPGTRASVRALGRRLTKGHPRCKSLSQCGMPISENGGGPGLLLTENGRMVGGQLVACRSPLRCAWCSPMQWQLAEEIGIEFSRRHERAGGWIVHSALTIPHRRLDSLRDLNEGLFDTWAGLRRSRPFGRAKKAVHLVTALTVYQVIWSQANGWHPHLHVAWLCLGDPGAVGEFTGALESAWTSKARSVTGRRVSRAATHSELVMTSQGFWKYCKPDDRDHPKNDCRHKNHPGCPKCKPPKQLDVDLGPLPGTGPPGPPGPDSPPFFDDPLDPTGPLEILSQVGPAALAGSVQAMATFSEYLTSVAGRRRIPSGWREAVRAHGPVDLPDPWSTSVRGGKRVWVHPALAAALELRQRPDSVSLADVIQVALNDPTGAAAMAELHLGEDVSAVVHIEDGAPILGRPQDLAGTRSAASQQSINYRSSDMKTSNTTSSPADAKAGRKRILSMMLDRLDDENARRDLLGAAVDVDSRAQSVRALRSAAEGIHAAVIDFDDKDLTVRWENSVVAEIAVRPGFPGRLIEWALEANDARSGKPVTPKAASVPDLGIDAGQAVKEVAAAA